MSSIIRTSYDQLFDQAFTDDASVVEKAGFKVNLVRGNRENIKITFPEDIKIAELLLTDKE
jgi:2-C-methyl-D-erythritol 4-phosphate cytidylyltransferase